MTKGPGDRLPDWLFEAARHEAISGDSRNRIRGAVLRYSRAQEWPVRVAPLTGARAPAHRPRREAPTHATGRRPRARSRCAGWLAASAAVAAGLLWLASRLDVETRFSIARESFLGARPSDPKNQALPAVGPQDVGSLQAIARPDERRRAVGAAPSASGVRGPKPRARPTLDRELALLERVRSALRTGDNPRALSLLGEYQNRLGGRQLADEVAGAV
ncbi:hypothetical protein ACFL5O_07390 [Myxococcota bacterium]